MISFGRLEIPKTTFDALMNVNSFEIVLYKLMNHEMANIILADIQIGFIFNFRMPVVEHIKFGIGKSIELYILHANVIL